jgi:hypothetical protein
MIISISGKLNSGKDTLGKILQILIDMPHFTNEAVISYLDKDIKYSYLNKKWASKLKDIVCILLNCTRIQLEDREYKEKELGEDWWYYKRLGKLESYLENKEFDYSSIPLIKLTPRLLLQLLGTDCGRNIIHPNIWINALMSEYTDKHELSTWGHEVSFPNWIITDTRFPNEIKAVSRKQGINIRIARGKMKAEDVLLQHESETALDNYKLDYFIKNDGTLDELVTKSRILLKTININ